MTPRGTPLDLVLLIAAFVVFVAVMYGLSWVFWIAWTIKGPVGLLVALLVTVALANLGTGRAGY